MNFKKLTSWLLTVVMVISLVPMAAFAQETTAYNGTISVYVDSTSAGADKTSDTGSVEISTMFPQGGSASYWVGFSDITGTISYSDSSNTSVSENISNISNGRYEIKIIGYGTSSYTFTITEGEGETKTVKTAIVTVKAEEANVSEGPSLANYRVEYTTTTKEGSTSEDSVWKAHDGSVFEFDYQNTTTDPDIAYHFRVFNIADNSPVEFMMMPNGGYNGNFNHSDFDKFTTSAWISPKIGGSSVYEENLKFVFGGLEYTIVVAAKNYKAPVVTDSSYSNATIIQETVGTGTVTVATIPATSAEIDNETDFSLDAGVLTFTKDGKSAGTYEVNVSVGEMNAKYVVALFPAVTTGALTSADYSLVLDDSYDDAVAAFISSNSTGADGYRVVTVNNGNVVAGATEFGNTNGKITPMYIYSVKGGAFESLADASFVVGGTNYLVNVAKTTVGNYNVIKVTPVVSYEGVAVKKTTEFTASITIAKNGILNTVSVVKSSLKATDSYNVQLSKRVTEHGYSSNQLVTTKGDVVPSAVFYFVSSPNTPNHSALLYDYIDISSIVVESTNGEYIQVAEYLTKDGDNKAIGFRLAQRDCNAFASETIKVSFNVFENGVKTPVVRYININCQDIPQAVVQKVTPAEAKNLQYLYDTSLATELQLEAGEYATDLYMWRHDITVVGLGDGAVLTGTPATDADYNADKAIITVGSTYSANNANPDRDAMSRKFKNIAIDGKDNTRIGFKAEDNAPINIRHTSYGNPIGLDYINNCKVAVASANDPSRFTMNIYGITFENNDVAIETKANIGYMYVGDRTTEILENSFINNDVDVKAIGENIKICVPQSYFEDAAGKLKAPVIEGAVEVNYMPYYATAARDTVQAQISPAAPAADTATKLEFPVSLIWTDKAVKLDKTVFVQIAQSSAEYNVSVPVTEGTEGNEIVTTVWNFAKADLDKTPTADTTLKVTNTLSTSAQALYNAIDTTKTDVKQVVNFAHAGDLPGTAVVHVLKDDATADPSNLKLYYLDVANNVIKEADISSVSESADGKYWIVSVEHCSEYIISTAVVLESTGGGTGEGTAGGETGGSTGSTTGSSDSSSSSVATTAPTPAPTAVPATPSANDFISAVEVEKKLEEATGETVTFDVSVKEIVSAKAFEVLANYPTATMSFEGDGYSWFFASSDITDINAIKGTSFNTKIILESANAQAIQLAAGSDAQLINLSFAYTGNLPGKATISVDIGEEYANTTKSVYLFNADDTFTYIGEAKINENGIAVFTTDYVGELVLTDAELVQVEEEIQHPTESDKEETSATPTTEEENFSFPMIPIIAVIAVATIVLVVLAKKKKEE